MKILGDSKRKILFQLVEQNLHGYDLALKIGISVSGIYQHLKELVDQGLIVVISDNRRKIYGITEKGRALAEIIKMK